MRHDNKHKGLQEHSLGGEYPWTIARIGDRCYRPIHCLSGEHGPDFTLSSVHRQSAHQQTELWIAKRKEAERKEAERTEKRKRAFVLSAEAYESYLSHETLREYTFFVPITEDHNTELIDVLEKKLVDRFDGFTCLGRVWGVWRNGNGDLVHDASIAYVVATNDRQSLVDVVVWVRNNFDQDCVYLSESGRVDLV